MTAGLRHLWAGELPLDQAFWSWAVIGGIAVNVLTSAGSLVLFALDQIPLALAVGYGLSLPYNLVVTVGVWRSADRPDSNRREADIYRAITLVGMTLFSVT